MNYWLRRFTICVRRSARKFRYEKFTVGDGVSAIKIFIFVAFGFLLGWHTTNLQVRQCEAEMDRHVKGHSETVLSISEEHSRQLQQQRLHYQKIIEQELVRMEKRINESRAAEKAMLANQAEIKNGLDKLELDHHNRN